MRRVVPIIGNFQRIAHSQRLAVGDIAALQVARSIPAILQQIDANVIYCRIPLTQQQLLELFF